MLLILTNSQDVTASFLASKLEKSGIPFLRLDTDCLLQRIALSYQPGRTALRVDGIWYNAEDIEHVWYRRPEQIKDARLDNSPESKYSRSEWTEFIECFFAHIPQRKWVNHPSSNAAASRKLDQLTTALALGFLLPDTLVTQDSNELKKFYKKHDGLIIVKPLSSGYIEREGEQRDSLIYTNQVFEEHLNRLEDLASCPTLFQQLIQKRCDVRITVLDQEIHAVALYAQDQSGGQRCDVRRNNMSDVRYENITLPEAVSNGIQKLMAHYCLRFGAIDMAISSKGEWYFFEINPNGQWAWLDMSAGTNIASSFEKSFSKKVPQARNS